MRRILLSTFIVMAALAGAAFANPGIRVTYLDGGVQLRLDGSYAGATYTVYRAGSPAGDYTAVTGSELLCLGECLVQDSDTVPGQTYQYRFDLALSSGQFVSYGPYAVSIPARPFRAVVSPNPSGGVSRVELSVPGGSREIPIDADARIVDLQGRSVRLLLHGTLARGVTSLSWNGRDDNGQRLRAGVYYLRFTSALGRSTTRIVRL
jgi:hypothetical protein